MTIAAKHFDPQLGIDIHLYLIPPSPIPIPLPTPHIGIVLDPFDYIPVIGGTVNVNGIKRATAGSMGLDVHIPVGGVWMPTMRMPMGPQWDDELFMGSKTVLADGEPFSRVAMPVLACNVVGMIAPLRPKRPKKPHLSLLLPTTINLAIPTNVFVGGPPTVSWWSLGIGLGLAGLGKVLKKTGIAGRAADAFKKVRQKLFKNLPPGFLKCNVLRAEPVDIRDGSVSVSHEDFSIPGRLPLVWTRNYRSNNGHVGHCGHGWQTPADIRMEIEPDGTVLFVDASSTAVFSQQPTGEGSEHAVREFVDGARLIREGDWLWVRSKDGLRYGFTAGATSVAMLQTRTLSIERIEDPWGNHWRFERVHGNLVRIVESGIVDPHSGQSLQGRFLEIDSRSGRIERMQLHDPATGLNHVLVNYRYSTDGDLVAVLDALEAARTFEYQQHRLLRHTDRVGLSFHYAYNSRWQVIHAWGDGGLYDYRFRYDDLLKETEVTDSLGHVSIVKFDDNGLPLCEIDPLNGVTVFEYDEVGRTTAVTDPMGQRTAFEYDGHGNPLKLIRADGSELQVRYDGDDHPVATVDPDGATWTRQWDARGMLCAQSTPLGATTRYDYDEHGQLRCLTNALGAQTRIEFDRHGQLARMTDPLGHANCFEHDAMGRLIRRIDAAGASTRFHHDAKGRVVQILLSDVGELRNEFDAEDRLLCHVDSAGAVTRLEYAGIGQLSGRIQPDGHAVRYEYDTEERLVAFINQRGERYEFVHDPLGRIVKEVDYWGQTRRYRFDAGGRLIEAVDPSGQVVTCSNDRLGRLTARSMADVRHPGCKVQETFRYDRCGQLIEMRNAHRVVQKVFDADGRLVEESQDGFRIKNTFDALGNRVLRETSAGNRVAQEFDARGDVSAIAINDGSPIAIERDALGRIVSERLGERVQRRRRYNELGLLGTETVSAGQGTVFETAYDYDRSGNMTQRSDSQNGVDAFAYDPIGRLLAHTDPAGQIAQFLHDPAGSRMPTRVHEARMQQAAGAEGYTLEHWAREGTLDGQRYVFDRSGNLVQRGLAGRDGGEEDGLQLRWDGNHRLVESRRDGSATRYGYDALGRRAFKRGLTHTTWFFWDGNALLGEVRQTNDGAHETAHATGVVADLMTARKRREASAAMHGQVREFVYYPGSFVPLALVDRRSPTSPERRVAGGVSKSQLPPPAAAPAPAVAAVPAAIASASASRSAQGSGMAGLGGFVLGGLEPVATLPTVSPSDAATSHTKANDSGKASTAPGNYVAGPAPASMTVVASEATEQLPGAAYEEAGDRVVFHYHVDPNGCPVRLTDADGRVVWSARYSTWGAVAKLHIDEIDNPLRYQGQYHDAETGLSYNRFRYYDTQSGQYVSQDPLRLIGGDDLYAYGFNPLGWIDPLGLNCVTAAQEAAMKKMTADALADMVAQGLGKKRRGPCFSVAVDLETGRMSRVYNNNFDGDVPGDLHPSIEARLPTVPPYVTDTGLPLSKGEGSHSEVYAVNELLNARPGATLDQIAVWSMEAYGNQHAAVGAFKEACPHCGHLLDGVKYVK